MPDSNSTSAWTTAQKLVESVEPCDIIEIRYEKAKPPKSHFIFNIRKGWCVHVIPAMESRHLMKSRKERELYYKSASGEDDDMHIYEGFKDAVDFIDLGGKNPCRINNLCDFANTYNLTPRTRKDALQIARVGLAEGGVIAAIRSTVSGDPSNGQDISKQFCLYWKYGGAAIVDADSMENKFLDKTIAVCGLVLVLLAAVVATTLSM